jgi:hypothetical protein
MDIVIESVKKLESLLEHSGCCDGGVRLDVDPDIISCRFEKGACMIAEFGNKRGIFTTFDPIRACTKISFMFGAPLYAMDIRGAAGAIMNVAAGFFCLARALRPCDRSSHASCGAALADQLAGKPVFIFGTLPGTGFLNKITVVDDPSRAEVILISGEGLITPGAGDLIESTRGTKRIICIGPSAAGISRLNELEHWCPFGRS